MEVRLLPKHIYLNTNANVYVYVNRAENVNKANTFLRMTPCVTLQNTKYVAKSILTFFKKPTLNLHLSLNSPLGKIFIL